MMKQCDATSVEVVDSGDLFIMQVSETGEENLVVIPSDRIASFLKLIRSELADKA